MSELILFDFSATPKRFLTVSASRGVSTLNLTSRTIDHYVYGNLTYYVVKRCQKVALIERLLSTCSKHGSSSLNSRWPNTIL